MKQQGFMWECECGNVNYGEYPPRECPKCQAIDVFTKVPEELREEKEAEKVLSANSEEDEDYMEKVCELMNKVSTDKAITDQELISFCFWLKARLSDYLSQSSLPPDIIKEIDSMALDRIKAGEVI